MSTVAKLDVVVGLDSGPLDQGLKDTRSKVEKENRNWGQTFKDVGTKFTLGVTTPVVGGFGMMISMASDQNEAMSAVQTVYGDASASIIKASEMSAKSVGMSQQEYLSGAATLGVYANSAGFAGDAASQFGQDILGAAADMASFYNADPSETLQAIESGLMGEAEPLRKYGILLNDATVNQYAWTHGIAASGEELTDQQKVAARYGYIMENMGAAQGDFSRTSGGLANQLRILKARIKDLAAQFGRYLLPMTLKWANGAQKLIGWIQGLSDGQKKLILIFAAVAAAIGPVLIGLSMMIPAISLLLGPIGLVVLAIGALAVAYATNFGGMRDIVNGAISKVTEFVSTVLEIGKAMKAAFGEGKPIKELVASLPAPLQSVGEKLLTVADAFGDLYSRFKSGGFGAMLEILPDKLKSVGTAALGLGKDLLNGIKGAIDSVDWGNLGQNLGKGTRDFVVAISKGFWENKDEIGKGLIKGILAIPALFKYIGPKALEFVKGFVKGLNINWPLIGNWMKALPGKAKDALGSLLNILVQHGRDLISGMKRGIDARWVDVKAWLNSLPGLIVSVIGDLSGKLISAGRDLISGLSTGVRNRWATLSEWIGGIPDRAVEAIGDMSGKLVQKGRDLLGGFSSGIKQVWSGAGDESGGLSGWIGGLGVRAVTAIGDLSSKLYQAGKDLMMGLWNGMKSIWENDIVGWLKGLDPRKYKGPPERDRKMLIDAGEMIMQGLGVGLERGWQSVTDQLHGYTPAIGGARYGGTSALSYASASPSTGTAVGSAFTWNGDIHIDGYNKDPKTLANLIVDEISSLQARAIYQTLGVPA